jgi:hypothetical protein
MPTSDGEPYGFKYVNGRENTAEGLQTVTASPVADAIGYPVLLSEMILPYARQPASGRQTLCSLGYNHGDDRQRRAIGIQCRAFQAIMASPMCACMTSGSSRHPECAANLEQRSASPAAQPPRMRRADHHDLHCRQNKTPQF